MHDHPRPKSKRQKTKEYHKNYYEKIKEKLVLESRDA